MADPDPNLKNLAAGIKLVHEEIRGLRGDIHAALKDAAEDRRRADVDRERSDRRFEFLVETIREERKRADGQFRTLMRGVIDVGRRIEAKLDTNTEILKENTGILKENTALLKDIKRGMNGGPGRSHGNGRPKT
ncbi:MAG TPA: hypothetical protein VJB14_07995 [Planctomycetota bacterium]|nr:hypothetical protein [Planctomycetota bacterium]